MDLVDRIADGFNAVAADTKINRKNFFENYRWEMIPTYGGSTPQYIGSTLNIGTITNRATTAGHSVRKIRRGTIVTTTAAGNVSNISSNIANGPAVVLKDSLSNQGFELNFILIPSCAALVSGHRFTVGVSSGTVNTNVEYSTIVNQVSICKISTSDNLFFCYGGTVAQTPIDLGVNFPAIGLQDDAFEINFKSVEYGKLQYKVTRLNTGHVSQGEIVESTPGAGVQLPSPSTRLLLRFVVTNNATALAASIDIGKTTIIGYGY